MEKQYYGEARFLSDDRIERELKQAREWAEELSGELVKRSRYSAEIKLAHRLHVALCQNRDCDWNYQKWDEPIMSNIVEPRKYLDMAANLIQQFTAENIERLLVILKK